MALPAKNRLRPAGAVQTALRRGRMVENELAALRYSRRVGGPNRFAFVISTRAAKKSHARNTLRRRAAGLMQKYLHAPAAGYDAVFIFKKGAAEVPRGDLYRSLRELLEATPLASFYHS